MKTLALLLCCFALHPAPCARRNVGPCMPYAEKCLNCSDCSQCGHCAKLGGKCSVCWNKR